MIVHCLHYRTLYIDLETVADLGARTRSDMDVRELECLL
jgi:hypothetical protein